MSNELDLKKLVSQLELVKDEFIKNKNELMISKRNDIIAVELKTILNNTQDYTSLKTAIEKYINDLYKI